MTPVLRRAMPFLVMVAVASAGCDSKSPQGTPTGPEAPGRAKEAASPNCPRAHARRRWRAKRAASPRWPWRRSLGAAAPFAVLGASTVTNTGPTIVNGDLGVSPGAAVVGFPPGIVTGTIHAANATSLAAQNSIVTAYNALAGQPCDVDLTGPDLGGLTLTPGVYCFSSSAQLTGTLTLDGLGQRGLGLGLQDRQHAHDRERLACRRTSTAASRAAPSGRSAARRRSGTATAFSRKRPRAGQHHPEHRRDQRRAACSRGPAR